MAIRRRPRVNNDETITIFLTRGQETKISVLSAHLAYLNWYARWSEKTHSFYAVRSVRSGDGKRNPRTEYLARAVMEHAWGCPLLLDQEVDHISHDTLDNTLENLDIVSQRENRWNTGKQRNNTSGMKGVHWNRQCGKWQARITYGGKKIYIGLFDCVEEAGRAYDRKCLELRGDRAVLNFR